MVLSHTQCKLKRIICKLHFNATSENLFLCNPGHTVLMRFCQHICFHGNCMKSLRGLLEAIVGSNSFSFLLMVVTAHGHSQSRNWMIITKHLTSGQTFNYTCAIHKIDTISHHEQVLYFSIF